MKLNGLLLNLAEAKNKLDYRALFTAASKEFYNVQLTYKIWSTSIY